MNINQNIMFCFLFHTVLLSAHSFPIAQCRATVFVDLTPHPQKSTMNYANEMYGYCSIITMALLMCI